MNDHHIPQPSEPRSFWARMSVWMHDWALAMDTTSGELQDLRIDALSRRVAVLERATDSENTEVHYQSSSEGGKGEEDENEQARN